MIRHACAAPLLLVLLACAPAHAATQGSACGREEFSLDTGWHFHLGDVPGSEQLASPEDADWKPVTLPHDWAIAGPFLATNPAGGAGAFAPLGVGWYRRHLPTPAAACPRRSVVQFDGIMANSDVWINGIHLGHRPNGYVTLRYDLTPFLNAAPGADNVLAVRADNSKQPASRFYQGAGLYRHAHLLLLPALHFDAWSTAVRTSEVTPASATVEVRTNLRNDDGSAHAAAVRVTLLDPADHAVAHALTTRLAVQPDGTAPFSASLHVSRPKLWDLDTPQLYRARVEVLAEAKRGDLEDVAFGIRDAHFEAATGFWLNGRNLKIKGVALHSDIGALGMAAPLSLWEHRLLAMKRMGANAVRTAHNPVDPAFLDLCDRLGVLVLDEFFDVWTVAKNPFDYHLYFRDWYLTDTRDTVRRDRNHPSIIAWSAGNEIHDTPHPDVAKPILAALVAAYHEEDPTRPVTQALFRPNVSHDYDDGLADLLDVIGQNYRPNEILAAHDAKPTRKILGTENTHDRASWLAVRDHPAYSGMFLWAGTDYLGESRHWPIFANSEGMADRTDFPKPDALERESWWADRPVVHIVRRVAPVQKAPTDPGYELQQFRPKQTAFADWTPTDASPHIEHVEVYSNCQQVKLLLNGAELGSKALPPDAAPRTWEVTFAPGTLEARCVNPSQAQPKDRVKAQPGVAETLRTAGPAAALRLTSESSHLGTGFDDVALVRLTVVDAHGVPVPGATLPITFAVDGSGVLLATDNAEDTYTAPFSSPQRQTLDGRAVVLLRGTAAGTAHVHAQSPGLRSADLDLDSVATPAPAAPK